jgi:hypothetical protein
MEVDHFVLRGVSEEALGEKSSGQRALFKGNSPGKPQVPSRYYVTALTLRRLCDRHCREFIRTRCR